MYQATSFISSPFGIALLATLVLLGVGFFALIIVVVRMNAQLRYLTYPVYDSVIKEANEHATRILEQAEEQRRVIEAAAHEAASKLLANMQQESDELNVTYEKQLEALVARGTEALAAQSAAIAKHSEQLSKSVQHSAIAFDGTLKSAHEHFVAIASDMPARLEKSFGEIDAAARKEYQTAEEEVQKRITEAVDKEITAAQKAAEAYRTSRMELVDKDIVRLVADTARIALGATLSLDEHRDLVIQALTRAKEEGIFTA